MTEGPTHYIPNPSSNSTTNSNTGSSNTIVPYLCDLKINIIANPNPVKKGFLVTYTIYIENFGPVDAYNLILFSKLPKIENLTYSFSGTEWYKLTGTIKIDKLSKNQMIILYISGILPQSFIGQIENIVEVKSSTPENNYFNNKATTILIVDEDIDPYICGQVALQTLLASKGIFVSLDALKEKLKPVGGMTSMAMMKQVAAEYGVGLSPVQISSNNLKKGDIVLLTINGVGHYVTIHSIDSEYVVYYDPIYGFVKIARAEFEKLYSGYALSTENEEKEINEEQQENLLGGIFIEILTLVAFAGASYLRLYDDKYNRYIKPSKEAKKFPVSRKTQIEDIVGKYTLHNKTNIYTPKTSSTQALTGTAPFYIKSQPSKILTKARPKTQIVKAKPKSPPKKQIRRTSTTSIIRNRITNNAYYKGFTNGVKSSAKKGYNLLNKGVNWVRGIIGL